MALYRVMTHVINKLFINNTSTLLVAKVCVAKPRLIIETQTYVCLFWRKYYVC